ncbi:histone h2a deubiquitinase mysm1 [Stylonychia lemnae]|uniref:Histone h2a deubiquitinase mysm1 n=1 Tax=Stylonychia lemnae TaxID=5949 RepID=A0A078BA62_STYLE|nr:histone h2a deubiquitinase mysm1 [Stylonychia lemnae]|eukprot:CDW91136.1 histone h2a deubiquitinase mysm1 [Stylonychia lemnae]
MDSLRRKARGKIRIKLSKKMQVLFLARVPKRKVLTIKMRILKQEVIIEVIRLIQISYHQGQRFRDLEGKLRNPRFSNYEKGLNTDSGYQLIECVKYGKTNEQKMKVYVTTTALLQIQIHCHVLKKEIIGFVGGYNFLNERKKTQTLVITEAYPGDPTSFNQLTAEEQKDLERNVEISPESYHPFFEPSPSQVDIENHSNHQREFSKSKMPYIGIIAAPFNNPNHKKRLSKSKQDQLSQSDSNIESQNSQESDNQSQQRQIESFKQLLQLKLFHNDDEDEAMPYELDYQILQEKYIKKRIMAKIFRTFDNQIEQESKTLIPFNEPLFINQANRNEQMITKGEKLMKVITDTLTLNKKLVNDQDIDYKDFSKVFRNKLRRDGSVIPVIMNEQQVLEKQKRPSKTIDITNLIEIQSFEKRIKELIKKQVDKRKQIKQKLNQKRMIAQTTQQNSKVEECNSISSFSDVVSSSSSREDLSEISDANENYTSPSPSSESIKDSKSKNKSNQETQKKESFPADYCFSDEDSIQHDKVAQIRKDQFQNTNNRQSEINFDPGPIECLNEEYELMDLQVYKPLKKDLTNKSKETTYIIDSLKDQESSCLNNFQSDSKQNSQKEVKVSSKRTQLNVEKQPWRKVIYPIDMLDTKRHMELYNQHLLQEKMTQELAKASCEKRSQFLNNIDNNQTDDSIDQSKQPDQ